MAYINQIKTNSSTTYDIYDKGRDSFELNTNKTTTISSSSTDTQYPTAKAVYTVIGNVEALLAALR